MSLDQPILITGGTGFAGTHLINALIEKGYTNIHSTHFGPQPIPEFSIKIEFHALNLTDPSATEELLAELKPSAIYHLASFAAVGKSFERAASLLNNNITLQLNILNAAVKSCPEARMLIIGSAEEYGRTNLQEGESIDESFPLNPSEPYGVSKVAQDLLAQTFFYAFKLPVIRVRPFNHIGEGQTADFVVSSFASQIAAIEKGTQKTLKVGNLTAVRDFTDVKDMVKAYILLMEQGKPGEVYNAGSGNSYTIQYILDSLIKISGKDITVETDPSRMRPSDIPYFTANSNKLKALGWQTTIPIEQTLQRILDDWRKRI